MPRSSSDLSVGGLARLSSVDWPGQLAATIFAQGCPWDCLYCHNPHLLSIASPAEAPGDQIPWAAILAFLGSRVGLLDGVVFSGGEPLAQAALTAAVADVRGLGFRTALHTSGVSPARFERVLPQMDWIGFDAKAPFDIHERVTRVARSGEAARASLNLLLASGVAYEVRTTVHPDLLGEAELLRLAAELRAMGVSRWVLQPFRSEGARPDAAPRLPSPLTPELLGVLSEGFSAFELRA